MFPQPGLRARPARNISTSLADHGSSSAARRDDGDQVGGCAGGRDGHVATPSELQRHSARGAAEHRRVRRCRRVRAGVHVLGRAAARGAVTIERRPGLAGRRRSVGRMGRLAIEADGRDE